jgi:hypothetical protein
VPTNFNVNLPNFIPQKRTRKTRKAEWRKGKKATRGAKVFNDVNHPL